MGDIVAQVIEKQSFKDLDYGHAGMSALTGAVGGFMMTLPGAGNYGAAILIGAATGGGNYLLTTAPSKYSPGGYLANVFGGGVGGMVGGPIKEFT